MISEEAEKLRDLLRRLREEDRNLRVFGADGHGYVLHPSLTEQELRAFEREHRIELPEDYRLFLKNAGNGGAGPYYGLATLEEASCERNLSRPFPFTRATNLYSDEELDGFGEYLDDHAEYTGALEICHRGCAIYSFLVVNGPTYGTIWEGREVLYPTGSTFGSWYDRWVERLRERALPMLANERLAEKVEVGMTKREAIEIIGSRWQVRTGVFGPRLVFENLATQFELNERDAVVRIIRFHI